MWKNEAGVRIEGFVWCWADALHIFSKSLTYMGLKKKLWQGKGEVTFAFTDIFNQFGIRKEINGDGFKAKYENYYETQVLRIGMKYKF